MFLLRYILGFILCPDEWDMSKEHVGGLESIAKQNGIRDFRFGTVKRDNAAPPLKYLINEVKLDDLFAICDTIVDVRCMFCELHLCATAMGCLQKLKSKQLPKFYDVVRSDQLR